MTEKENGAMEKTALKRKSSDAAGPTSKKKSLKIQKWSKSPLSQQNPSKTPGKKDGRDAKADPKSEGKLKVKNRKEKVTPKSEGKFASKQKPTTPIGGKAAPKFHKPGFKLQDKKKDWKAGQKKDWKAGQKKDWKTGQKKDWKTGQKKDWKAGQKEDLKAGETKTEKEDADGTTKRPKMEEMKKKERKQVRKQLKTNFELSQKAKTSWEIIRKHDCKAETRNKHVTELCELLDGRVMDLVKAHDTVRVIQCCIQFGTNEQRAKIFEEVKDHIVDLAKSKYAKFYVLKMFRYGTKEQRLAIMRSFHGKVGQLIRHKEAAEVLEEAYNNHANAQERSALMEEFYGARFAIFKESGIHTLEDILQKDPSQRQTIMDHMLKTLTPLLDKTVVKHTIVHKAICDFLQHAPEKMRAEFIESMREVAVQILHTQDGARAAMHCLWHGTAKDRKVMIKSFKTYVLKVCKEEFGHRVLLALFDSVDDTKIVSKVILEEMMKSAYEVATDQYGRKVLLYLLVPRDPSHFHPDIVKQLQKGDSNPHSKKEPAVRRKELLEAASPALLKLLITHTKEMAYSNSNSQLALAMLQHIQGDKSAVYSMLATLAAEELVPVLINDPHKKEEMHIVEHPSGHLLFKRLLAHEKTQREAGEVSSSLSASLLEELSDENIRSWLRINRGAFVLVSLSNCGNDAAKDRICSILESYGKNLAKLTSKGVQVLKEKLKLM